MIYDLFCGFFSQSPINRLSNNWNLIISKWCWSSLLLFRIGRTIVEITNKKKTINTICNRFWVGNGILCVWGGGITWHLTAIDLKRLQKSFAKQTEYDYSLFQLFFLFKYSIQVWRESVFGMIMHICHGSWKMVQFQIEKLFFF